jgi:hypothetical protein
LWILASVAGLAIVRYYNKLCRIISPIFCSLVLVRQDLLALLCMGRPTYG